MSEQIETMIANIINKEYADAGANFNDLIGEKVLATLDEEKIAVSGVVYNGFTSEDLDEIEEDTEELDELSNKTLKSYRKGAKADIKHQKTSAKYHEVKGNRHDDEYQKSDGTSSHGTKAEIAWDKSDVAKFKAGSRKAGRNLAKSKIR